jgi:hypothetical protein
MEVALRECLATAMWNANAKTGLRVSIVPLIQKVLNELLPKTDLSGAGLPGAPSKMSSSIINRGTGAGGAATNASGKPFEELTSNESRLLEMGFQAMKLGKKSYLSKGVITFLTQGTLRAYIKKEFGKTVTRNPDEAYLVKRPDSHVLRILEKKNQNGSGSVSDKLYNGPSFVEYYQWALGAGFKVEYAYCLSPFLEELYKKDAFLQQFYVKHNIAVFFSSDSEYFTKVGVWALAP